MKIGQKAKVINPGRFRENYLNKTGKVVALNQCDCGCKEIYAIRLEFPSEMVFKRIKKVVEPMSFQPREIKLIGKRKVG